MKCPFCGYENISGVDTCDHCDEDLTAFDGVRPKDPLERSLVKDPISSITKSKILPVSPDTPIRKVAEGLNQENRCGLVMDGDKLVGIITAWDLLHRVLFKKVDLDKTPISEIMTPNPETLNPDDKIVSALNKMAIGGYRHVPIRMGDNQYGVVSIRDILGYLALRFPDVVGVHE